MAKKLERTKHDSVTEAEYSGFQTAFDFFNRELFGNRLPNYLITLQRKANSQGYFGAERFSGRASKKTVSELALNPDSFTGKTDEQICDTLVHEMVHGWQYASGTPSRRGYHNTEWAEKMKAVGLYPSSTGMVGGKETGQHMSDYIIPDGPFACAYAKLKATGFKLNWQSSVRSKETKPDSKTKFTCPKCGQNAWGKSSLQVRCRVVIAGSICNTDMVEKKPERDLDRTNEEIRPLDGLLAIPPAELPVKAKRPKGSNNKPKAIKSAGEELTSALSRHDRWAADKQRKKQQQNADGDVFLGPCDGARSYKRNRLNMILFRFLDPNPNGHPNFWGKALSEAETNYLKSIDREKPTVSNYYEAVQIERRVHERRNKKWNDQQKDGAEALDRTNDEADDTSKMPMGA